MDKKKFNLVDLSFSHHTNVGLYDCSVAGQKSNNIIWVREINGELETFYSNEKVIDVNQNHSTNNKPYGLLFESRAIIPKIYQDVEKNILNFEKMFTHHSDFLKKYNNCFWIPGGGIWIGGDYGGGEIKLHKKSKLCSIVSSKKQMCDLHNFRLNIVDCVKKYQTIDVYGIDRWSPIWLSLHDYMFSIVVENYKDELYFTEKILNCFATGTIPIYCGAKNLSLKFDMNGVITFETIQDLHNILPTLNEKLYQEKIHSVIKNYKECQQYKTIEDYIYNNYLE